VRIDVTGAGMAMTKARRDRVRRRVLLAMSRFDRHVLSLRARLGRSRTSLGGTDVHCRVGARLRSGRKLEAEAIDGQVEAAVGRCSTRLALLIAAALDGDTPRSRLPGGR
jgi:ribosome-associated translation inhibitor RaiA